MTTTEISLNEQGFTARMSQWADEYAAMYDWEAIRDEYNDALKALAPEGVDWGWAEYGAWCYADSDLDPEAIRAAWHDATNEEATDGTYSRTCISLEHIAGRHEITTAAVIDIIARLNAWEQEYDHADHNIWQDIINELDLDEAAINRLDPGAASDVIVLATGEVIRFDAQFDVWELRNEEVGE